MRAFILGAGVAGLAAARELIRNAWQVEIIERSAGAFLWSSGRNAAILRTYESDPVIKEMVTSSAQEYRSAGGLLEKTGIHIRPLEVDYSLHQGERKTVRLAGREFATDLSPDDGILDPHAIRDYLLAGISESGRARFRFNSQGNLIPSETPELFALQINENKHSLGPDEIIINATGAWSAGMFPHIPVIPHRRHLFTIAGRDLCDATVFWDDHSDFYIRRTETPDEWLATMGDQDDILPDEDPESGYQAATDADARFLSVCRELGIEEKFIVSGRRACLRSFTLDNRPVVGRDPVYPQLYHITGLGGRGMSLAFAAASELARSVTAGNSDESWLDPGRFR